MDISKVERELQRGADISIISLIDHLIDYASTVRASDIHICPTESTLRVRLRIDGVLDDVFNFPKEIRSEVISRIKVMAGMRTDEHQIAQDGRFRNLLDSGPLDIRVSIVPTYYGENAVLRLLSGRVEELILDKLGFVEEDRQKILKALSRSHGMILATGPTGSGKTTTLYSLIKLLNTKEAAIITIEDPVEYALEGINQIQVNNRSKLSFASGLRSILRQDPDIIMVGEIRDFETAGLAVNTSLTGHLLLSTLHTSDAATTLPRLLDLGVEPYLVASTVNIIIAQRLVRKICFDCKIERALSDNQRESLSSLGPKVSDAIFYEGEGCERCKNSGYSGRLGIYEVLAVDAHIREAFLRKASASEIKAIAQANGMTTMLEDGFKKAQAGLTTIEEILRVINE